MGQGYKADLLFRAQSPCASNSDFLAIYTIPAFTRALIVFQLWTAAARRCITLCTRSAGLHAYMYVYDGIYNGVPFLEWHWIMFLAIFS